MEEQETNHSLPATGNSLGVNNGGYGLVVIREDGLGPLTEWMSDMVGKVGYYDDDVWEPHNKKWWDSLPEPIASTLYGEKYGTDNALVYFGSSANYILIPHEWLRPATQKEALSYSMAMPSLPVENRTKNINSMIALAVFPDACGNKLMMCYQLENGNGDGLRMVREFVDASPLSEEDKKKIEFRIHVVDNDYLIKNSYPHKSAKTPIDASACVKGKHK